MKNTIMVEWFSHFFWLIGWSVWCLIQFDFDNFIDTLFWLKIHLTCKSDCVEKIEMEIKQEIINTMITLLGFIVFCLLILSMVFIIVYLIKI